MHINACSARVELNVHTFNLSKGRERIKKHGADMYMISSNRADHVIDPQHKQCNHARERTQQSIKNLELLEGKNWLIFYKCFVDNS